MEVQAATRGVQSLRNSRFLYPASNFVLPKRTTTFSIQTRRDQWSVVGVSSSFSNTEHARQNFVLPPFNDAFLPWLAEAAQSKEGKMQAREMREGKKSPEEMPPLLDIAAAKMISAFPASPASSRASHPSLLLDSFNSSSLLDTSSSPFNPPVSSSASPLRWSMNAPAQVERGGGGGGGGYGQHRPRRPPPDLPSLLLNSRIVYIGMPFVPAVTELVIAEFLYLQWLDPRLPIYVYVNSTGTSRADGETVGMETEGFAIYDTMMSVKNEIHTVGIGAAIGQACLILSAGEKGKRFMLPHATAMIQQPRVPSTGQMPAIDVQIRAKEVTNNRDTLVRLLAKHTGNTFEKVAKTMERPYYMNPQRAMEFGVVDKVLWRGQEAMAETLSADAWDKKAGVRVME